MISSWLLPHGQARLTAAREKLDNLMLDFETAKDVLEAVREERQELLRRKDLKETELSMEEGNLNILLDELRELKAGRLSQTKMLGLARDWLRKQKRVCCALLHDLGKALSHDAYPHRSFRGARKRHWPLLRHSLRRPSRCSLLWKSCGNWRKRPWLRMMAMVRLAALLGC